MATRVIDDTKLNNIAVAIQAKDSGGQMTVDEMRERIAAIPKPVNEDDYLTFYDYNGTLLYSYTEEEAMQMTELPPVPVLEGYTIGWNYTLAEIQEMDEFVIVGAQYTPNDGSNAFTLDFETPYAIDPVIDLTLKAGTYTIDWGDGSELETIVETSDTAVTRSITHHMQISSYPASCVIKIRKISGYLGMEFQGVYSRFITDIKFGNYDVAFSLQYANAGRLKSVALSTFLTNTNYFIRGINSSCILRCIVIPTTVTTISDNTLNYMHGVYSIPPSVINISANAFRSGKIKRISFPNHCILPHNYSHFLESCYELEKIRLPKVSANQRIAGFYDLRSLRNINIPLNFVAILELTFAYSMGKIKIPKTITSMNNNVFDGARALTEIDLTDYQENDTFPTLSGSLGTKLSSELRITVYSQTKKEELSAMTNWSQYADIIIVK